MINTKFQGAMWQRIGAGVLGLGAFLMLPYPSIAAGSSNKPVTFAKDVAPIFQAKCQECHHPGTAAPMSLVTYEETRPWADKIKERVATRNMPPWHLDRTVGIQHFKNDTSSTDGEIDTIVRWVDTGMAQGNPNGGGLVMEWAFGKQYDVFPANTGKLLLPGARIRRYVLYHRVGEAVRD